MKAIGGYFELADSGRETAIPIDGAFLNTGRNALEYILLHLPDLKRIFLPFYTCEAVIQPLRRLSIEYSFYHINERFEIAEHIQLNEGDYLIANNYFGLKDAYIARLAKIFGDRLIVDNAQAFFAPVIDGIKAIYSPRKFVGVSDGGIAVGVDALDTLKYDEDDSSKHDSHLKIRKVLGAEAGFKDYQANESKLDGQPIRRMSETTADILYHIDYEYVRARRKENFKYIHTALGEINQIMIPPADSFACPMVYPFLCEVKGNLRARLIDNKVFVARYWPNVLDWTTSIDLEKYLAINLFPLPIDQRYGKEDMERIVHIINN